MGVGTILEAREIVLLATGEHKAHIVRRAVEGEVDHEVAATFLQRHPNTTFYLDPPRRRLTRVATPWLLGEVEWTTRSRSARSSGSRARPGKAILKLTQRDYAEHHLSSLVARTARRARSTAWSSTRSAPRSGAVQAAAAAARSSASRPIPTTT